jgi:hypothetical protein
MGCSRLLFQSTVTSITRHFAALQPEIAAHGFLASQVGEWLRTARSTPLLRHSSACSQMPCIKTIKQPSITWNALLGGHCVRQQQQAAERQSSQQPSWPPLAAPRPH